MRDRGRYQIQFMKTRSSSGVGQKVDLEFNVDTLRITDLGEDDDSNSAGAPLSKTASMVNSFKRTSELITASDAGGDPKQGSSVKPVKQIAGSAPMIRNMLKNLNPEKD